MKSKIPLLVPIILAFVSFQFFIANEVTWQWVGILGFVISIASSIWMIWKAKGWLKLIPTLTLVGVLGYLSLYGLLIVMMGNGG